jgi:hypothetical protein
LPIRAATVSRVVDLAEALERLDDLVLDGGELERVDRGRRGDGHGRSSVTTVRSRSGLSVAGSKAITMRRAPARLHRREVPGVG